MAWAPDATLGVELDTNFGTARTYTTDAAVASGAWIILAVHWASDDAISSVSGGSLTWSVTQVMYFTDENKHAALVRAYAPAGLASASVITFTMADGNHGNWKVGGKSYTGGDASSFDTAVTNTGATTAVSSGNITTAVNGEFIVSAVGAATFDGTTNAPGANVTEDVDNSTTVAHVVIQRRDAATAGTYTATSTLSALDGGWGAATVALKPPAAAVVSLPPVRTRFIYLRRNR